MVSKNLIRYFSYVTCPLLLRKLSALPKRPEAPHFRRAFKCRPRSFLRVMHSASEAAENEASASIQFSGICIAELSTVPLCLPLCRNDQFYVLLSNFIVINTNQTAAAPRPVFSKFRWLDTANSRNSKS